MAIDSDSTIDNDSKRVPIKIGSSLGPRIYRESNNNIHGRARGVSDIR